MPIVEGEIFFDEVSSSFSGAAVYVRIEDVSRADAPSQVLAEEVLRNVSLDAANPRPLRFSLRCPELDERASYIVSVHVDVDGSGRVTRGDFLTMQSYPIPASQARVRVSVHVRPV